MENFAQDSNRRGTGSPVLLRAGSQRPVRMALSATIVAVESLERPVLGPDGNPLPSGCALELGYFSKASPFALFAGRWTPIVGPNAIRHNRDVHLLRTGYRGEMPGCFSWCRTFYPGIDVLPPSGVPLALRIYDHADPARARNFNTASHPSWWFRSPRAPDPTLVDLVVDETSRWESGPDGAFETFLPKRTFALADWIELGLGLFERPQPAFRPQPAPSASLL